MPDRRPEARRGGDEACVTRATDGLAERIAAGDRRALARAITLVESSRADHRAAARGLLAAPARPARRRCGSG